jgi:predicted DCC family thiol-disulfide oxidoreductase YuxK
MKNKTTLYCFYLLRKGKGTLVAYSPLKKLVVDRMYEYVRNSVIKGVLTVLIGESIAIM